MSLVTLLPLAPAHAALLQDVYDAAPAYWARFGLAAPPVDLAAGDLAAAATTPGRTLLGILRPAAPADPPTPAAAQILVGVLDLRRDYPDQGIATIGLLLVAEAHQRQGVGRAAWALLEPWLAQHADITAARLSVEQFNHPALHFFTACGFHLTGAATRQQIGDAFVRYLEMEKALV